jgi:CheY-like chemotaxis protein
MSERLTMISGGLISTTDQRVLEVLCIEDEPLFPELIADMLGSSASVHSEGTLREALAAITSGRTFDVAVLDLSLPDANGLAGIATIHRIAPDLPIVVLTAQPLDTRDLFASFQQKAAAAGADAYIVKGADAYDILMHLRFAVAQRHRIAADREIAALLAALA